MRTSVHRPGPIRAPVHIGRRRALLPGCISPPAFYIAGGEACVCALHLLVLADDARVAMDDTLTCFVTPLPLVICVALCTAGAVWCC